jgi:hypothetical protein
MMIAPMNPRRVLRLAVLQVSQVGESVFDGDQVARRLA